MKFILGLLGEYPEAEIRSIKAAKTNKQMNKTSPIPQTFYIIHQKPGKTDWLNVPF